jgi:flagellar biosynthesis/type III secretory pathway chaperone
MFSPGQPMKASEINELVDAIQQLQQLVAQLSRTDTMRAELPHVQAVDAMRHESNR